MQKLFVYGTLRPGQPNEHILKEIGGQWKKGYIWGELFEEGWGAELGSPGIRLKNKTDKVEGYVFYSDNLSDHWKQLDSFEGEAYERVMVEVELIEENQKVDAFIYVLKNSN